jgi:molybdenum cofactor cytidylyltransferase
LVPGIILAAGASTRMGRSKALLPCGGDRRTFVAALIDALREGGASDAIVVIRPADAALRAHVEAEGTARIVENPRADEGQLSSLIAGLNAADRPGVGAVLVTPVDVPLVRAATVARLLRAFDEGRQPIVRPSHGGRHGHPVIFGRAVFDELRRADPSVGARVVVRADPARVLDVEVEDAGVLVDIDTPRDYETHFGSSECRRQEDTRGQ